MQEYQEIKLEIIKQQQHTEGLLVLVTYLREQLEEYEDQVRVALRKEKQLKNLLVAMEAEKVKLPHIGVQKQEK